MEWRDLTTHLTGPAHLATVGADGWPHVAKVLPAVDGPSVWIAMRSDAKSVRNAGAHSAAALMFEAGAEVYLQGTLSPERDESVKRRLADAGLFPFRVDEFFGPPEDPTWLVLRLTPTRATVMIEGAAGPERRTWVSATR